MDNLFAMLGKLVLIVTIIGGVAYGAYSLGETSPLPGQSPGAATTTAAPTEPLPTATNVPSPKPTKVVQAGLDASSGLSFTKYQMTVPEDWVVTHTTTNEGTWVDTLILTKDFAPTGGKVQLKIFQAATGGALCLYPGDADFEGPSSRYDVFENITTADGIILRRGTTKDTDPNYMTKPKSYTVCQKSADGSFGQPTVFGHMSLSNVLGSAAMTEVDAMIASLKKR